MSVGLIFLQGLYSFINKVVSIKALIIRESLYNSGA